MFTKPTVFVLGAGVSVPFGFPSGERLLQILTGKIDNSLREARSLTFQHETTVGMLKYIAADPGDVEYEKAGRATNEEIEEYLKEEGFMRLSSCDVGLTSACPASRSTTG
jgi:hypothetical protein